MLTHLIATTRLAARNLIRQRRRGLLALAILTCGVTAYLLAGGFIEWLFFQARESTIHAQLGHIQITKPKYFSEGLADPYRYLLPPSEEVAQSAAGPDAVTVTPRLAFNGLISKDDATVSFIGEGIDPNREAPITRGIMIVEGRDLTGGDSSAVLLGEGLAASLGATPGDMVVTLVTTATGGVNAAELRVAGIFATSTKSYDDTVLRAPIGAARDLMRVGGSTSWVLLLDSTESTEQVVARLRSTLAADEYEVVPWYKLADFYNKTVELFTRQIGIVRILIAVIVILSISNTLLMTVVERTGEIGTIMALGVRRRRVLALFVSEGLLLGLIGGISGVVVGHMAGWIVSWIGIPMPPPPGMARGYTGEIMIPLRLSMDAFMLAFSTALIASLLPAWKASRMNIVDALRHQR